MIETVPPGTILHGRYRIERALGSGGFGHVYLAADQTNNQQQYAVKEYLVTGASGQEQLNHEATVLSHLNHPSLPGFQDAFIEQGRYYIVLDYIEGYDLTDLVRMTRQRNESIPISQVLGWLIAICDAVLFLHNQRPSIIHRDIKPDNIRITPSGTATLVDLGNAKAAADGARTLFFIRHQGTPGYAPPEQYPGGSGTDTRSDVYALGGTLYFALTTHEPPSVSARNQSIQQGQPDLPALQDHLLNNPPDEGDAANTGRQFRVGASKTGRAAQRHSRHLAQLGTLPPAVLVQLNQVIHKAMAMKPKNRYQYVSELANGLRNVLAALPVTPPPSTGQRADYHTTQPDLPELYEALQAAKEHGPEGGTQPMVESCPRCGMSLKQKAGFCPRCGTSLAGPTNIQSQQPHSSHVNNIQGGTSQQAQAMAPTTLAVTSYAAKPHMAAAPAPGIIDLPTARNGQRPHSTTNEASPSPLWQRNSMNSPRPSPVKPPEPDRTGFQLEPKIIIAIIIALALVMIIIAFIVFGQHGHPASYLGSQW